MAMLLAKIADVNTNLTPSLDSDLGWQWIALEMFDLQVKLFKTEIVYIWKSKSLTSLFALYRIATKLNFTPNSLLVHLMFI